MSFRKIGIILFLILCLLPTQKLLAQSSNTGFVSGNIWYSKDPFEEGDKIKIYTLIFNPDTRQLSGTVNFFDNTILLGKKNFAISAGAVSAISVNWTATAGDHNIFGQIENAKFLLSSGSYEAVSLAQNKTEKSSRTVSKKIILQPTNTNTNSTSVSNITKTISENTPDFIAKPILSSASGLEALRENLNIASNNKQNEVKKEIETLNKIAPNPKTPVNPVLKPFKYIELFLLSISSFILNNKIVFYGLLAVLLFFILRFIWNKLF